MARPWREGDAPVTASVHVVSPYNRAHGTPSAESGAALVQTSLDRIEADRQSRELTGRDIWGRPMPPLTPEQYDRRVAEAGAQAASFGHAPPDADNRSAAQVAFDQRRGDPSQHAPDPSGWPQTIPLGTRTLIDSTPIANDAPLVPVVAGQLDAIDAWLAQTADSATAAKLAFIARRNGAILNLLSGYARAAYRYSANRPA